MPRMPKVPMMPRIKAAGDPVFSSGITTNDHGTASAKPSRMIGRRPRLSHMAAEIAVMISIATAPSAPASSTNQRGCSNTRLA